jgi:hypothetical protein
MIAVVYETDPWDLTQSRVGTIRVVNGRIVGQPADQPAVRLILSRPTRRLDGTFVSATEDPEGFLRALPEAYTGTFIRVGLEDP